MAFPVAAVAAVTAVIQVLSPIFMPIINKWLKDDPQNPQITPDDAMGEMVQKFLPIILVVVVVLMMNKKEDGGDNDWMMLAAVAFALFGGGNLFGGTSILPTDTFSQVMAQIQAVQKQIDDMMQSIEALKKT